MPAVSKAQKGYAGISSTSAGRAKLEAEGKTPMPIKAAKEFRQGSPKVERKSKKEGHMASEKNESKAERKREGESGIKHLPGRDEHHKSGSDRHGGKRLTHALPTEGRLSGSRTNYHEGSHMEKRAGRTGGHAFAGIGKGGSSE